VAAQQAAAAAAYAHVRAVGVADRINEQARREAAQAQVAPQLALAAQPVPPSDLVRNPMFAWQHPGQPPPQNYLQLQGDVVNVPPLPPAFFCEDLTS
jgi:hypothetical protein